MNERKRFILEATAGLFSHSELCRRPISARKTGYKWLERYETEGPDGLLERSHRPHCCPHATEPHILEAAFELRRHRPRWGAAKNSRPGSSRCTPTGRYPRPRSAQTLPARGPSQQAAAPTQTLSSRSSHRALRCAQLLLSADFKGQFKTSTASTATRSPSRMASAVTCSLVRARRDHLRRFQTRLTRLFHEFGIPDRIRTDNGSALRLHCLRAPLPALRLVDQARHPARSHRARISPTERPPRTHAQRPQG